MLKNSKQVTKITSRDIFMHVHAYTELKCMHTNTRKKIYILYIQ